jgi:flagellar biosynthesis GTPase FlhF
MRTFFIILLLLASIAIIVFLVKSLISLFQKKNNVKKNLKFAGIAFLTLIISSIGLGMTGPSTTQQAEIAAKQKTEEEAKLKAEEEAKLKAEEEAKLKAKEEAKLKAEEEARLKAEEETKQRAAAEAEQKAKINTSPPPKTTRSSVTYSSCKQARSAGAAPLYRGQQGYSSELDRDGDGVACE